MDKIKKDIARSYEFLHVLHTSRQHLLPLASALFIHL